MDRLVWLCVPAPRGAASARTPAGCGADAWTPATADGARSPQEQGEDGQPPREPRDCGQLGTPSRALAGRALRPSGAAPDETGRVVLGVRVAGSSSSSGHVHSLL